MMLPILICASDTPGPYFFFGDAIVGAASSESAARQTNERRVMLYLDIGMTSSLFGLLLLSTESAD